MKTSEILYKAADHLNRVGLFKGGLYEDSDNPETSPCCTLGALEVVRNTLYEFNDALRMLESAVGDVAAWNDSKPQSKKRVVAKLRQVASEVEEFEELGLEA